MENTNNLIQIITVHAKEVRQDKKSFITCTTLINGVWYRVKFNKTCNIYPRNKGTYDIKINIDNCSIERGHRYVKDGEERWENDIIWIKQVESMYEYTEDDYREINRAKFNSIFG